jgi:hypothetical protein
MSSAPPTSRSACFIKPDGITVGRTIDKRRKKPQLALGTVGYQVVIQQLNWPGVFNDHPSWSSNGLHPVG